MKIQITKRSIIITPTPKKDKKNGLKVSFARVEVPENATLPIMSTDIKKGQRKYTFPTDRFYFIKSIEL